jgi:hypothetical protein
MVGVGYPTLKMVSASVSRMISFSNTTDSSVRGFILDGNSSVTPTDALVVFLNTTSNCVLEDCDFINAPSASTGTVVLSGSGIVDCQVIDNRFTSPEGTAIGMVGCQRNTVAFNYVVNGGGFGVHMISSATKNLILGNHFNNTALEGVGMDYTCSLNTVQGNHAEATGDNGISISGDHNTVTGNVCVLNDNAGIGIWGDYNSVTGNVCKNNRQSASGTWAGIWLHSSFGGRGSYNTVTGNACDDDQAVKTQAYGVYLAATGYTAWGSGQVISGAGVFRAHLLNLYVSTGAGTTGVTAPTHTSGTVTDGAVSWTYLKSWSFAARPEGNTVVGNALGRFVTAAYTDAANASDNTVIERTANAFLSASKLMIGSGTPITYSAANNLQINAGSGSPGINLETTNSASVAAITCGLSDVQDGRLEYNFSSNFWDIYAGGTAQYRVSTSSLRPQTDNAIDVGASATRFKDVYAYRAILGTGACQILTGSGSPESVVTAPIGSLYLNTAGGVSTTLYVKTSGAGNTGWTAK